MPLLALGLALLLSLQAPAGAQAGREGGFKTRPVPINDGRLFDLGVSDYDTDGVPEIFSVNHKFLGTLIEGAPGNYRNLMGSTGFSPTPAFPGFEDLLHPPKIGAPGLYIYAESRAGQNALDPDSDVPLLHIVANDVRGIPLLAERARGTVRLPSPSVQVVRKNGAQVQVRRAGGSTVIEFTVAEQGHIVLRVRKVDLPPIEFDIDQRPLLASTFVGARKVRALNSDFTLRLIDRHGIAWSDTDYDGHTDAFVVRGGLGGGIADFPDLLHDELLRPNPLNGRFSNEEPGSGLNKGECRSRQAASVDYDRDGRLDLFSSCKGATPKLYRAVGGGDFRGFSKALRKVRAQGTYYRWADLDGDRRPELIVADDSRVRVFRSRGIKRWRLVQRIRSFNRSKLVYGITVGDYDRDGDPDLFVGANSGNTLLKNRRGRLRAVAPRRAGLPPRGSGAAFVDYDNDGRLDLHSMPSGLYRQKANGRFARTGLATAKRSALWGITNWFDYDSDGFRDNVTAIRTSPDTPRVRTRLRQNRRVKNHWLEFDLRGAAGNHEAVGARVKVRSGGRTQTSWVGDSDTSRYSQGNYRLYFGLGGEKKANKVAVRWPNGARTKLRNVAADRVLTLSQGG